MTLDKDLIFNSFAEDADIKDINWFSGSIVLVNKPTLTYGLSGSYYLKNIDGSQSRAISWFQKAGKHIEEYFKYASSRKIANEIEIIVNEKILVDIIPRWNQTIVDTLESSLPKSKKGKYKPWYIDDEEWNKDSKKEVAPLKHIDIKTASFPVKENAISDDELTNLSLKETALLVSSYCSESENILWDAGCLFLQKNDSENITAELIQYYFDDESDKENGNDSFDHHKTLVLTDRMVSIYTALQKHTKQIDASFEWDSVFITISRNGLEDLQFILNEEELDFIYDN
jgi:hypothetical protein